ncbi:LAQU0S08e03334g1_1 [Lachancea quebecensis]|uniref:LAQU0S08e03334g1_1 n=1 Tax=Lachancea quebecensis TaxID=1654605 RepID=A0A0P1KTK7_9SACH|nr:LAQU0S08e03334g1_1 [Lachancea quebecensis]
MGSSAPAMANGNQTSNVRGSLSNDALNLGLNLALPADTHDTTKTVGTVSGSSLADILGSNATPQAGGENSHASGASNATPASGLNESTHAQLHSASPAQNAGIGPQRYGIIQQVSGSSELGTGNSTTTSVQICQRMDEVSARMIAMEEMFNKLYFKINEQEATIQHLRLQSEAFLTSILSEVRQVNHNMPILDNPDDNEKDGFVTDLLNSITNVSSNYLKKVNTKHSQKYKRQRQSMGGAGVASTEKSAKDAFGEASASSSTRVVNETSGAVSNNGTSAGYSALLGHSSKRAASDLEHSKAHNSNFTASGVQEGQHLVQDGHSYAASEASQLPLPHYLTQQSFTLNPNGIKRRRANTATKPTFSQSHQDISSLNGIGSMSLPNLTIENLTRKNQTHSLGFNVNTDHGVSTGAKLRHRNIEIQVGSDNVGSHELDLDSSEDEEGYQEDDEDRNSDRSAEAADAGRSYGARNSVINAAEEAEDETESYGGLFEPRNRSSGQQTHQRRDDRRNFDRGRPLRAASPAEQPLKTSRADDEAKSATAPRNGGPGVEEHRARQRERDLNYTLLKAPANVRAIWQEYIEGIEGQPAVKFLEEAYGNKWRLKKNVKTFARRKRLYKFIINGIKHGRSADDMIKILEDKRIYKNEHGEVKKRTIGWLQQSLSGI